MVRAIADWFGGSPWRLSNAFWSPEGASKAIVVSLAEERGLLLAGGWVVARRSPRAATVRTNAPKPGSAFHLTMDVCREALERHLARQPA
jgi:hypothetical protein